MIDEALSGFGEVQVCGWPWHGLIKRAGDFEPYLLYLPNGTTRPHPIPEAPWFNYRVQVPGVPAVVRSTEQQAEDTAAGREWRPDALLGGRRLQLYYRELGGWIYCAADGSRWLISVNLMSKTATAIRFGMVGMAPDVRTATVSWPMDEGQSTPALGGLVAKLERAPVDLLPNGQQGIFMFYTDDPAGQVDVRPVPLGFLLCSVSGSLTEPFALNFTVLRTRQQALGTPGYTDDTAIVRDEFGGITSANGTATRTLEDRVWAMWFDTAGEPRSCSINILAEFEQQCPADLSSYYTRNRVRREISFDGDFIAINFESEFDGVQASEASFWEVTSTGRLNGVVYASSSSMVEKVPSGVEPPPALTDAQRQLSRGVLSAVFMGDFHDHQLIGNNALAFYILITPSGMTPTHRYLGAMTSAGIVSVDESMTAATVSGGTHYTLYGPKPFGAFNPSTYALAYPEQYPVGWV